MTDIFVDDAIKRLATASGRFLTEIRTAARLQHPHALPLQSSGLGLAVVPNWLSELRQLTSASKAR